MSVIDDVRERVDILDVVGGHVQLKKAGRTYKALCPFHPEKTPSFVVYPDTGTWRCFGACGVGGDVFAFVMRAENTDFRGALELLARRAGVALEAPSPQAEAREQRQQRLHDALAAAATFYHRRLMRSPDAEPARAYLKGRAFSADVARLFELGWAPAAWSTLAEALRADGFADEELVAAGLARSRESGGVYDYFRGRLTIPIRDGRGRAVGFGARTLDPEGQPKYLNSPQTDLFDKSHVLFGLDRAARTIRQAGEAVVVEGYTDVIRAHAAGCANVVASLGTALTIHQLTALKRHARVIVLALDADAAGQAATVRGLAVAQEALVGDEVRPVPTAQGWVRYVQQLDVDLRVATLPAGQDPDDVLRADPEHWRAIIRGAEPVMGYLMQALTQDLDLASPRGKSDAIERLLPFLAEVPDPVLRSAWVAEVARRVRVDERSIETRLTAPKPARRPRRAASPPPDSGESSSEGLTDEGPDRRVSVATDAAPVADLATYILGHLLAAPRRLKDVNALLRVEAQPPLGPDDLDGALERDLLAAVRHAARGVPPPDAPPEHRLEALPEAHRAHADMLLARAAAEPPVTERERVAALHTASLRLRERANRRALEGLRFLQAEAEPGDRVAHHAQVLALTAELLALQRLLSPDTGR